MTRLTHRLGLLTAIGVIAGAAPDLKADETEPSAAAEHHIYLHVMPPKDGEPVRIIVAPHEEQERAPAAEPADDPEIEDAETDALIDEILGTNEADEEEAAVDVAPIFPASFTTPVVPDSIVVEQPKQGTPMGLLLFIFVLAIFLGLELISKVPSQLHTPLMSGSNAISGITIVGALAAAGLGAGGGFGTLLGALAVAFATINVVGGYMVTNRMLAMFKKKDGGPQ